MPAHIGFYKSFHVTRAWPLGVGMCALAILQSAVVTNDVEVLR